MHRLILEIAMRMVRTIGLLIALFSLSGKVSAATVKTSARVQLVKPVTASLTTIHQVGDTGWHLAGEPGASLQLILEARDQSGDLIGSVRGGNVTLDHVGEAIARISPERGERPVRAIHLVIICE
jgi:hypothetical protein